MNQRYPIAGEYDEAFISSFATACEAVAGIRSLRQEKGLSPKEILSVKADAGFPCEVAAVVEKLANVKFDDTVSEGAGVTVMAGTSKVFVALEGLVNVAEEIEKLEKELAYCQGFLASVRKKLSNERFVSGAPEAVVANERKKEADTLAKIETIEASLKSLK